MEIKVAICPHAKCRMAVVPDAEGKHAVCGTPVYFVTDEAGIRRWVELSPLLLPVNTNGKRRLKRRER